MARDLTIEIPSSGELEKYELDALKRLKYQLEHARQEIVRATYQVNQEAVKKVIKAELYDCLTVNWARLRRYGR